MQESVDVPPLAGRLKFRETVFELRRDVKRCGFRGPGKRDATDVTFSTDA